MYNIPLCYSQKPSRTRNSHSTREKRHIFDFCTDKSSCDRRCLDRIKNDESMKYDFIAVIFYRVTKCRTKSY